MSVCSLSKILILCAILATGCSVPSLETPTCTESKNALRDFYSFHFARDMKFSEETLSEREKFLTPDFRSRIASSAPNTDPFTSGSEDLPKAFRAGACRELSTEETEIEVLIFWKTDDRSEQRLVRVAMRDVNDTWLLNNVSR